MSLEDFLGTYGYWAILVGTFFEGETILMIGGFAAHQKYLHLPWVILTGFAGTVLGDQLYFYLGRIYGLRILNKRTSWQKRVGRVQHLLERYQNYLIFSFRFIYGLRTITPFVIGMSRVSPRKFLFLNVLGALIWSLAVGGAGYLSGNLLEAYLGNLRRHELAIFCLMALIGILIWGVYIYRRRRQKNSSQG